ncbi:SNARE domain-containing protein [Zalerion maritima]|uniref:t-SNARE affecting a late Golgi compartment protein 1 n=1 Tax=Zalerion maritima TaxID=339359 RepID=A0AAD5WU46_9PEZI|nr:SNARE domain-containing protein [Zalerion maritima]
MMAPGDEDPFLQVQQDVQTQLQTTRGLFSSYLRIRNLSKSSTSPELQSARADLDVALEDLREDVSDLSDAVKAAEREPSAFGLDGVEVSRRRRHVTEAAGEVEDMVEELSRENPAGAASSSGQQQPNPFRGVGGSGGARRHNNGDLPDPSAFAMDSPTRGSDSDDDYAAQFEQQTQAQMMRDQDEQLGEVYVTVGNLRNMADDMGRELHEQTEMLGETDRLTERVGERLQTGMDKMKHVIRKNEDSLSSCCIAVLITVLIILLVLLLIL